MNIYSKESRCVKCGEIGATSAFTEYYVPVIREVIARTCANCGNKWLELPMDAPTASFGSQG